MKKLGTCEIKTVVTMSIKRVLLLTASAIKNKNKVAVEQLIITNKKAVCNDSVELGVKCKILSICVLVKKQIIEFTIKNTKPTKNNCFSEYLEKGLKILCQFIITILIF
jgi:hypothetical protein